jgi:serine/threonine-protein kinase
MASQHSLTDMASDQHDQPPGGLAVTEGIYMVGRRNPDTLLQCNTYLRQFRGGRGGPLYWCIDPGSRLDYPVVRDNLLAHLGSLRRLSLFSLNHQDPDVVGNLGSLTDENDELVGLVTEDAWRLVQHLAAKPKELHFPGRHSGNRIKLSGGQRIQAVPTPFCHFRGAMAFYDPETRVLFSGDLFGGLNEPGRTQLFAEEADWPGIAIFHQIYMPSRACTSFAIRQIRALDPPVEMIAPQHGFVLAGDLMRDVMERLESLPVGMDRLPHELDAEFLEAYRAVIHEVIRVAGDYLGVEEVLAKLERAPQPELHALIEVCEGEVDVIGNGIRGLSLVVDALCRDEPVSFRNILRLTALRGCQARAAPLADIAPGMEATGQMEWIG